MSSLDGPAPPTGAVLAGTPSVSGRSPRWGQGERPLAPYDPVVPKSTCERWMGVPEAAKSESAKAAVVPAPHTMT